MCKIKLIPTTMKNIPGIIGSASPATPVSKKIIPKINCKIPKIMFLFYFGSFLSLLFHLFS
jgi:hypothetical protein